MSAALRAVLFTLLVITGCGKDTPRTPIAPTPAAPLPAHLTIAGPDKIAPGTMVQFSATAHYAGGSTKDVTQETTWRPLDTQVFRAFAGGTIEALDFGESPLSATYKTAVTSHYLYAMAPDTFRVIGSVTDSGLPVMGARIDVINGTSTGRWALSDDAGMYRLYGVAGDVTIRATKTNYLTSLLRVIVDTDHRRVDVALIPSLAPRSIAGSYTVTFTARGTCGLPEELRNRTYMATVHQSEARAEVQLTGGRLTRSTFLAHVSADTVKFILGDFDGYHAFASGSYIHEQLDDTRSFTIAGTGSGHFSPFGVEAFLDGAMTLWTSRAPSGQPAIETSCSSPEHQVTFQRR